MNKAIERYNHPDGYNRVKDCCTKYHVREIPLAHEVYVNKAGNKCWRNSPAFNQPLLRLNNGRVIPWNGKLRHIENDGSNYWDGLI